MAGPVPFNAIPGSKASAPVAPPEAPTAPSAVAAPAAAAQSPEPAPAQEAPAPKQPRPRRIRDEQGHFLPAKAAKPAPSADERKSVMEAEQQGVQEIQAFLDDKRGGGTQTKADSVQVEVKAQAKADEAAPETPAAEGAKPKETANGLDEAGKQRALDAGFKPEELAGLTANDVDKQVVLRDRWIAAQGSKLATGEKKPDAQTVPEPTPVATVKPVVKTPESEFKTVWKKPEEREGTEVDDEIKANVNALQTHYEAKLQAQQAQLDEMTGFIRQQRVEKEVAEADAVFSKHKDVLGETSIAKLDPKNPKDMLKKDVYQTAVGMVSYFKSAGLPMPSDQEIVDRAVAVVKGVQPVKPEVKPATTTVRASSRQPVRAPDSEKEALEEIDQFLKDRRGY